MKRSNDSLTEHLTAALDQARPTALALPSDAQSAEPRELSPFSEVITGQHPARRARQAAFDFQAQDVDGKLEEFKNFVLSELTKTDLRVGKVETKLDDRFGHFGCKVRELGHFQNVANNKLEELEKSVERGLKNVTQQADNLRTVVFEELRGKFEELNDATRATRENLDALSGSYHDSVAKLEAFGAEVKKFEGEVDVWAASHHERVDSIEQHIKTTTEAVTEQAFADLSGRIASLAASGDASAPASLVMLRAALGELTGRTDALEKNQRVAIDETKSRMDVLNLRIKDLVPPGLSSTTTTTAGAAGAHDSCHHCTHIAGGRDPSCKHCIHVDLLMERATTLEASMIDAAHRLQNVESVAAAMMTQARTVAAGSAAPTVQPDTWHAGNGDPWSTWQSHGPQGQARD